MRRDKIFCKENAVWFFKELVKTFSNQPSFFSRKRFESFILFINAIVLLDLFYIKQYSQLDTTEALMIFAANLGYAGWQTTQIKKDLASKTNTDATTSGGD